MRVINGKLGTKHRSKSILFILLIEVQLSIFTHQLVGGGVV